MGFHKSLSDIPPSNATSGNSCWRRPELVYIRIACCSTPVTKRMWWSSVTFLALLMGWQTSRRRQTVTDKQTDEGTLGEDQVINPRRDAHVHFCLCLCEGRRHAVYLHTMNQHTALAFSVWLEVPCVKSECHHRFRLTYLCPKFFSCKNSTTVALFSNILVDTFGSHSWNPFEEMGHWVRAKMLPVRQIWLWCMGLHCACHFALPMKSAGSLWNTDVHVGKVVVLSLGD